jgi:tetratricopeptide (TPR) repeat protein
MKRMGATARKGKAKARTASSKPKRKLIWRSQQGSVLVAATLVAVVFACYANSIGNGFVFDDEFLVPAYSRAWSLSHLVQTLLDSYRPVRNASYAIDFLVWGSRPFGFHLTNVLIHAANSVLVFFLIRRFTVKQGIAFLAALIFAVHPIQTDSVSYVSGRRDVLFALFYLAAFHAYLGYRASRSRKFFALFLGFWALSLMSKEMAVSLPLVIFIWNFCELWGEGSGSWLERSLQAAKRAFGQDKWLYTLLAAASLAFGVYVIFFVRASGRAGGTGLNYWGGSLYATVLTVIRVHTWYFKQLIYPTPIAQYFGAFDIATSLLDWRVVLALVVVGTVLIAGAVCLKKDRLMAFAVFSYFAALAPVSQIIPHHELLADHYLYLPMMSFSLLVALIVNAVAQRGKRARQVAYCVIGAAIAVLAGQTVSRNPDWKDELAVWEANYKAVPYSPRASYNLGGLYMVKDPQRSEALLKESIASDPSFEPPYLALAKLYVTQKRTIEAEKLIQQGLDLIGSETRSFVLRNPSLLRSQFTTALAAAKWEEGDRQATEQLLREAAALYPWNLSAYDALANLYHNQDRGKEEEVLRQALSANPSAYDVRARLAVLATESKRFDEALTVLREMLDLSPAESVCEKARPYLAEVKARVPKSMEQRSLSETLELVLRQCAVR